MSNYMLHGLTQRSNAMMAGLLRTHSACTPTPTLLAGTELDEVLEELPRQLDTCKVQYVIFKSI